MIVAEIERVKQEHGRGTAQQVRDQEDPDVPQRADAHYRYADRHGRVGRKVYSRKLAPMGWYDHFKFGKYEERMLMHVMREDPAYVAFLVDNLDGFRLEPEVRDYLEAVRRMVL